jgi:hypothetical protein
MGKNYCSLFLKNCIFVCTDISILFSKNPARFCRKFVKKSLKMLIITSDPPVRGDPRQLVGCRPRRPLLHLQRPLRAENPGLHFMNIYFSLKKFTDNFFIMFLLAKRPRMVSIMVKLCILCNFSIIVYLQCLKIYFLNIFGRNVSFVISIPGQHGGLRAGAVVAAGASGERGQEARRRTRTG